MSISNAQLAQKISDLIDAWRLRDTEFAAWLTGTANGGPDGDGRYDLTSVFGDNRRIKSPARLESDVTGVVGSAAAFRNQSEVFASSASTSASTATTQAGLSETARVASEAARATAQEAASEAVNAAANALAAYQQAVALNSDLTGAVSEAANYASAAIDSAVAASTSASNAAASASASAASATAAALFDPSFYTRKGSNETITAPWVFSRSASDISVNILNSRTGATGETTVLNVTNAVDADFGVRITPTGATSKSARVGPSVNIPLYLLSNGNAFAGINSNASVFEVLLNNSAYPIPIAAQRFSNSQSDGQTATDYSFAGVFKARVRIDYVGNHNFVSLNGGYNFFQGGDSGTGVLRFGITNTGDFRGQGKIQSYGWDGDYYNGHAVQLGVTGGFSYLHSYNATNGSYPPMRIAANYVDFVTGNKVYGISKSMLQYDDSWLRLNPDNHFASGVYTPGVLHASGAIFSSGSDVMATGGFRWYPDQSFYMYNTASYNYGSWRIGGMRNNWGGLVIDTSPSLPTFMAHTGGTFGLYAQVPGRWSFHDDAGNGTAVGSALHYTTAYTQPYVYVASGGARNGGKITISTAGPSGTPTDGDIWIQRSA